LATQLLKTVVWNIVACRKVG